MSIYCDECNIAIINKEDFGDLTYDCNLLCSSCLNIYNNKNNWYCYILKSINNKHKNKTYNGSTNNPKRRIRQHNGIIKGGAKYTSKIKPTEIYCIIKGFTSKKEALRCEWRIKHPTKKRRRPRKYCGIDGRIEALNHIFNDTHFTSNSEQTINNMKLTIWITKDKAHLLKIIPQNTTLLIVNKINIDLI